MSSIDERVVQMKFDNAQFESGIKQTQSSLDGLKKGLNLDASAKSLENLNTAGSRFSLAGISEGIDGIASKFSALSIVGITALTNIANRAIDTGLALVRSLTIDPISEGFSDYNAKLTSVQTIMNATGSSIEEVSGYFSQLDVYADKTIYNLSDMTGAFAKFTNAGVGMDKSVPAIKGIANMVALAGQDAGAASIAMYNLSQSIAGGFLTTTDYKSLNLANVATKEWKDHMIEAAVAAGQLTKVGDKYHIIGTKAGAASTAAELFNDDLKEGWASTEVLMKVLGDYGDTQTEIGKKAQASAQDVKSWGMMMETLGASVGTGWTDTFEILFGNITEAKALFTPLTNTIGGMLDMMSEARNKPLMDWKQLGGRTELLDALKQAFWALQAAIKPIIAAFKEIFPPVTGQKLLELTKSFKAFTATLIPNAQNIENIKRTFKGVFAVLDVGWLIVQKLWGVFERLWKSTAGVGTGILGVTAKMGDFLVKFHDALLNSEKFNNFFVNLGNILTIIVGKIKEFAKQFAVVWDQIYAKVKTVIDKIKTVKLDTSGFTAAFDNLRNSLGKLKPTGDTVKAVWDGLINVFKKGLDIGKEMAHKLGEAFGNIGKGVNDGVKGINFEQMLGIISVGLLGGLIKTVKGIVKSIKGAIEDLGSGGGILDTIKETFGGLTDTLSQMQSTLKASTLLLIAGAIALLTYSVVQLSKVDANKLPAVLGAMTVMFIQLSTALAVLDKMNLVGSAKNMAIIGGAMILLAIAIKILASAMEDLSKLSWDEILKGLVAVTGMLIGLSGAAKLMSGQNGNMIATGIGLIAVAVGVKILASAVKDFSEMDWQKMMQGLIGVGIVLGGLALFTRLAKVNKGAIGQAAGLILLGVALKIMASAVNDFANLNPATIQQGLGALTGVLMVLAGFTRLVDPKGLIGAAVGMVILGGALKIIATAVQDFGNISWEVMGRGLTGMAGALAAITISMRLMPTNMIVSAAALVIVAQALKIMAEALKSMGGMSWEEIGKGFTVLGSSLLLIAIAMDFMTTALPGAAALLIVAAALTIFVPVLQTLGTMPWAVIGQGFAVLAAAFILIGVAGLVLAPVVPALMGLGIAIALLGIGAAAAGLGMLAFSAGLTALAVAGAAGATALIAIVAGLLGLIPYAFQMIGQGIVAFAKVLTDNVPVFIQAAVALMQGILTAISIVAPQIVDTLLNLVLMLLQMLVKYVPQFVDAGMKILIGFLQGIANNIGQVVNTAVDIIVNFLNGITNNLSRIINAGTDLIIAFIRGIAAASLRIVNAAADTIVDFVNGLASAIDNHASELRSAGLNLARAIVDGMTGGLASAVGDVVRSAQNLAGNALDAAKNLLGIHSPSREFFKIGDFSGQGLANGILSTDGLVATASEKVGRSALDTMKDKLSGIWDQLDDSEFDMNPTITPVLDLTTFKKDSRAMSSSLAAQNLAVDTSYGKAAILATSTRANQDPAAEATSATTSGPNITYIQNNNSPKALSPVEIYRGTKNQLSTVKKGELVKS